MFNVLVEPSVTLAARVGESVIRVCRLTVDYGAKRYYRCSTCETINSGKKKTPKLITTFGSVTSSQDIQHQTLVSRWVCSSFMLEKSISSATERLAKDSMSLLKCELGWVLGSDDFPSVFKPSISNLFVVNEWIFLSIWNNPGSQSRSQWWRTTRYDNTVFSLGNCKWILCCEPPKSSGGNTGSLRVPAILQLQFTREPDKHHRKVILQDCF